MLSSKELKQQAKDSLKGRWGTSCIIEFSPNVNHNCTHYDHSYSDRFIIGSYL